MNEKATNDTPMTAECAMAELWGLLCPDAGPHDYRAVIAEVEELQEKLKFSREDSQRARTALSALWNHLKALGHPFSSWPVDVKDAVSWACVAADQRISDVDVARVRAENPELFARHTENDGRGDER